MASSKMVETRSGFKDRLVKAGRWEAFLAMRDQLRAEGNLSPKEADRVARRAFPPEPVEEAAPKPATALPSTPDSPPSTTKQALRALKGKERGDEVAIIRWIGHCLGEIELGGKPDLSTAPEPSAVGFLQWASASNGNKRDFYLHMWSKLVPPAKALADREKNKDDGRELTELIEQLEETAQETGRFRGEAPAIVPSGKVHADARTVDPPGRSEVAGK